MGIGRTVRILIITIAALICLTGYPVPLHAQDAGYGFDYEITLDRSEQLDAVRFLQQRLVQPYEDGRYLVRAVHVLNPVDGENAVFAYLVTFQISPPDNYVYDLDDFYSVGGYYIILLTRNGDDVTLLDEIPMTPVEIIDRLNLPCQIMPPEITDVDDQFDFTDAVFDASDSAIGEWRENMLEYPRPRWEWTDLTGDGILDCILDIEGFEFNPSSYYTVLVTTEFGFLEAFSSWGIETDFTEFTNEGDNYIRAEQYSETSEGAYIPIWRDYYRWNGTRYSLANLRFSDEYTELVPGLETLVGELVEEESSDDRWSGKNRFVINATRFSENNKIPTEYIYNLARIADYQVDFELSDYWWTELAEYLNDEYDAEEETIEYLLPEEVRAVLDFYRSWRDELYSAAEVATESN